MSVCSAGVPGLWQITTGVWPCSTPNNASPFSAPDNRISSAEAKHQQNAQPEGEGETTDHRRIMTNITIIRHDPVV